jgi:WD40 repeat protein
MDKSIYSEQHMSTIQLWHIDEKIIRTEIESEKYIYSIKISPNEQIIAGGINDGGVVLWDLDGNKINSMIAKDADINVDATEDIIFSPDSKLIANFSPGDGEERISLIGLWDLSGQIICRPLRVDSDRFFPLFFTPDGKFIVSSTSSKANFWLSGGIWQDYLQICCDYLHDHPILKDAHSSVAMEACEFCQKFIWDRRK